MPRYEKLDAVESPRKFTPRMGLLTTRDAKRQRAQEIPEQVAREVQFSTTLPNGVRYTMCKPAEASAE